ncbi:MAG: LemA family protein [Nanoarchaeota archaeon]
MAKKKFLRRNLWLIVIILAVILVLLYVISAYNSFIVLEQNINGKWSEVENQYQRQADLIQLLVPVVSSSVKVETKFVSDVTALRTGWQNAQGTYNRDKAGVDMTNGVTAFINAVAENYPVLQANKQYVALTDELAGTQNRISVARGRYIEAIQSFNTAIKKFPANLLAGMFGFSDKDYYKAELSAMETPVLGTGVLP